MANTMGNVKSNSKYLLRLGKVPFNIKEIQEIGYIIKYMGRNKRIYFSFKELFMILNKHYKVSEERLNIYLESMFYEFGILVKRTSERTEDSFKKTHWGLIWKAGQWANSVKES